jgi:hypothetical protein
MEIVPGTISGKTGSCGNFGYCPPRLPNRHGSVAERRANSPPERIAATLPRIAGAEPVKSRPEIVPGTILLAPIRVVVLDFLRAGSDVRCSGDRCMCAGGNSEG